MQSVVLAIALLAVIVAAQDPAPGWLAYATAQCPAGTRITHMEAKWTVGADPPQSFAFFSPWFGIDTSDNLNLLQPVNPWFGTGWSIYTEYYQWSPSNNKDSTQMSVSAGDQLYGKITFNGEAEQSYTLSQTDVTTGQTSQMTVPVQKGSDGIHKNYTIQYIVYEKVAQCYQYSPDQSVTFNDIQVFCNGVQVQPQWSTGTVENVCDFTAHVVSPAEVKITWNTDGVPPTATQMKHSREGRRVSNLDKWREMKKEINRQKKEATQ